MPLRPPRTGTTASGSAGAESKASMSRSIRLGAIRGMSPSRMTAPRAVLAKVPDREFQGRRQARARIAVVNPFEHETIERA